MKRMLLGLALVLALLPGVASAHAELVSSTPADGASIPLASAPTQMSLTFSEEVAKDVTTVQVSGPGGAAMADGAATVDFDNPKLVTVKLKALIAGTYTAKWHAVTSDDNGQTDGTVTFTIVGAAPASSAPPPSSPPGGATTPASPPGGTTINTLPQTGAPETPFGALLVGSLALLLLGAGWVLRRVPHRAGR